jgi:acetyl esterase/lipase
VITLRAALALLLCLPASLPAFLPASAQAAPAEDPPVPLWPAGAPGSEGKTAPEVVVETDGIRRVSSIHNPSLGVHLPSRKAKGAAAPTGAAVIILPGGGHRYLSIDNEGHAVARWLNAHGVAGFVLKYRLAREEGSTYKVAEHALQDVQRALRLVRSRAKQWGIDPARVGILGFSAGGDLATYAASRYDTGKPDAQDPIERESARPAFQGLLYPGAGPADLVVPKDAPPAFLCTAADDKTPTKNALTLFGKLREAGIDAEMHVYAHGGHGFGMKDRPLPVTAWATRFHEWLGDQGFLKAAPPPSPAQRTQLEADHKLDQQFAATIQPFMNKYCLDCHGAKPKGDLDLRPFTSLAAVQGDFPRWTQVLEKLTAGQMPPSKANKQGQTAPQPPAEARQAVVAWIEAVRTSEARKHAGDPGPVLARRLSNAEYNYTIRDLTGVDIRPTREFPVDPSNPAGFDNSGESLAMSPALMKKYLQAAREVASHMVLETSGIAFAPHPMLVETDRDKYCVNRIVDFYRQQNTDLGAYFRAAWRFKHRAALGQPRATLAAVAAEQHVSPRYLDTVWNALEQGRETVGPLARLQTMWRKLPAARSRQANPAADAGFVAMRDFVVGLRKKLEPHFTSPAVKGLPATAQPLVMWRNRQYASHRMSCDHDALQIDGKLVAQVVASKATKEDDDAADEEAPAPRARKAAEVDPDLAVPSNQRERYQAAFDRFCATFPDAFYVSERGRNYEDKTQDKGRLLSAGFHNLMGYFRDDQPLYQLLLNEQQQGELDRLWHELDFVAGATRRTFEQFSASGPAAVALRANASGANKAASKDLTSEVAIKKVEAVYLSKVGQQDKQDDKLVTAAIKEHFSTVNASLRWAEAARGEAQPKHLQALLDFAARAYRRSLTTEERDGFLSYYQKLRTPAGGQLDHEEAMRDLVVSVLMSPDFCYRIDLVPASNTGVRPLSDHALASRLSYFLWSTMPDAELLAHARAGDLHRPEVLTAQAKRMLKDARARGLAVEFGGNWLDFRRFEQHNAVDRERFPSFDGGLRTAMFEEPVRFLVDVFARDDRSVLDFLYGKHTFVNPVLAKHYGVPPSALVDQGDGWSLVADATRYGRGGLLPMAAFLTKNAPGLRTSPVKRGYWVVKNVLGERIPPPPAVVPELPRDEAKLDLPLREVLARHREDQACAGCHARFDALGLVFEGYGPIGERREKDLAGRPVDVRADFPGGANGSGLPGLRQYLRQHRQDDFVDNLARKLLAYGLGRSLMPSDDTTVAQMKKRLAQARYHFDSLVEVVVTSPQFLNKRGRETLAAR